VDYRDQLRALKAELVRTQKAPDQRRIIQATKLAEDLPALWRAARPERRKQLLSTLFETIKVSGGRVTAVRPIQQLAPLFAVKASDYTSAVPTGFEPAISSLTGTYARPLHHGTNQEESVLSRSPLTPL
jgi:hypothetical protein